VFLHLHNTKNKSAGFIENKGQIIDQKGKPNHSKVPVEFEWIKCTIKKKNGPMIFMK
jgi:hypothetical protein